MSFDGVEGDGSRELFGGSIRLHVEAFPPPPRTSTGSVTYSLRGAYTRLLGVPAAFGENYQPARVRVYGDGRLLADLPAPYWSFRRSSVDVTGVRLLRIELSTRTDPTGANWPWRVIWGDGRLT
jgi:hypothetical protein